MPSTYTPIATQTLGSTAATVTFSSIPSTYTDLVLITNESLTSNTMNSKMTFNGSSASDYSRTYLIGYASTVISGRETNQNGIPYGYLASTSHQGLNRLMLMNYSSTSVYKTVLTREDNASDRTSTAVGLWRSTSAINQITLTVASGSYTAGSTFTLYGVKSA